MKMAYRERWEAEIAQMRRVLAGFAMKEECKWGKPTYTVDGKNIVIMQGFKEYFALGFFQGALLKDPKRPAFQTRLRGADASRYAVGLHRSHRRPSPSLLLRSPVASPSAPPLLADFAERQRSLRRYRGSS
jgi:hypothetical protein